MTSNNTYRNNSQYTDAWIAHIKSANPPFSLGSQTTLTGPYQLQAISFDGSQFSLSSDSAHNTRAPSLFVYTAPVNTQRRSNEEASKQEHRANKLLIICFTVADRLHSTAPIQSLSPNTRSPLQSVSAVTSPAQFSSSHRFFLIIAPLKFDFFSSQVVPDRVSLLSVRRRGGGFQSVTVPLVDTASYTSQVEIFFFRSLLLLAKGFVLL